MHTQEAPMQPDTPTLHYLYPFDEAARLRRDLARQRVGNILSGEEEGLVAYIGGCAMNEDAVTIRREGAVQAQVTENEEGLYVVHRRPMWKPRTRPEDWAGLETGPSDNSGYDREAYAEQAYRTLWVEAVHGSGMAVEIGKTYHVERYSHMLVTGWFGARLLNNTDLRGHMALHDPALPLAVKNPLSGDIQPALEEVQRLNVLRAEQHGDGAAPVVLLYRGGENARTLETWEYHYRAAMEATEGKMVADMAHGCEQAHDPAGAFGKSDEGQRRALNHVYSIAGLHGEMPRGIMAEASDAASPTDPHTPHAYAIRKAVALNALRRTLVAARV